MACTMLNPWNENWVSTCVCGFPRVTAFRGDVKADNPMARPGQPLRETRHRRLRLLISYLQGWVAAVFAFFTSASSPLIDHTIACIILDDTNMRLSQADALVYQWMTSRVVSVMNVVQVLVAFFHGPRVRAHKTFTVHTPMVCVPKADCDGLFFEMVSRLMLFLGVISYRFRALGLAANLCEQVAVQGTTFCMDALATNQAVLKRLRMSIYKKHEQSGHQQIFPALVVLCQIHALALARKCLVNALPGFWSCVVRLGHLFEVSNFKMQFKRALVAVVYESYRYIPVPELPGTLEDWRQRRLEWCNTADGAPRLSQKRADLHITLMSFDNGDYEQDDIRHFCIGSCCSGRDHGSKARHALLEIVKLYLVLFGNGYPVPLTYRWVHASRSLQYLKEPWHSFSVFPHANANKLQHSRLTLDCRRRRLLKRKFVC